MLERITISLRGRRGGGAATAQERLHTVLVCMTQAKCGVSSHWYKMWHASAALLPSRVPFIVHRLFDSSQTACARHRQTL